MEKIFSTYNITFQIFKQLQILCQQENIQFGVALITKEPNNEEIITFCKQHKIKMLDIGTGANGIYPLLASQIYGWHCVASDINNESLENVGAVLVKNPKLNERVELRRQYNKDQIFEGIIKPEEQFDISVCNPPFHSSKEEAQKSTCKSKGLSSYIVKQIVGHLGKDDITFDIYGSEVSTKMEVMKNLIEKIEY